MNILETEWWTMALPPEWWADTEEDSVLVGDRDDVGCIEISTLHKDEGVFTPSEVREIAESHATGSVEWRKSSLGDFNGVMCQFVEEDAAIREWYVGHDSILLFITYSCTQENRGMDDAAVDELLDTLCLLSRGGSSQQ